jgi:hypothetical protein
MKLAGFSIPKVAIVNADVTAIRIAARMHSNLDKYSTFMPQHAIEYLELYRLT